MKKLLEEVRKLSEINDYRLNERGGSYNIGDIIGQLVDSLDEEGEMDDRAYARAKKVIYKSKRDIESELDNIESYDNEISVIMAFDESGRLGDFFVGNIQYWQGVSRSSYPYRAYALV